MPKFFFYPKKGLSKYNHLHIAYTCLSACGTSRDSYKQWSLLNVEHFWLVCYWHSLQFDGFTIGNILLRILAR